jgi:SAM-dependent methyltransferase
MTLTYSALAPIYDKIMAHVEYDRWISYIKQIIDLYSETSSPAIFEIGGGTGILGARLLREGMDYQGSDVSVSMCRQALRRGMNFFAADARFLPLRRNKRFDLVVFLYDGINYLHTLEDYGKLLSSVHAHLTPRGLFLFDITTTANSLKNFNEFVDAGDFNDHFFFRRSYYHAESHMQYNDFTIFSKTDAAGRDVHPGLFRKAVEHHAQRVFPVASIKDIIPKTLFSTLGVWDDFSFKHATSRSERVHFLLQKAA